MSKIDKKWILFEKAPEEFLSAWPEYSRLSLQLLYNRGLRTQELIDEFFNPDYSTDLHDPFLLKNMDKLVRRLALALKKNERVVIYGDYDADGVTGTLILESALIAFGIKNISVYIPDRSKEGYGLNEKAVKEIAQNGKCLIITIDCGITDVTEVNLANKLGLQVVIVDHHLPQGKIPKAKVIVNPWQKGDKYPFKQLSGAVVAFKVAQALIKSAKTFPIGFDKWLLDLAAISTIADYMPLLGENRAIVKYGLVVLAQTKRTGLRALMDVARVEVEFDKVNLSTNLDSGIVGFSLVPRLNAASRMDHANTSYQLLKTDSIIEAEELAKKLDGFNRSRQKRVEEIMKEAETIYQKDKTDIIFAGSVNWSPGLLGLVASKLVDRYYRPAFIYSMGEIDSRGSVRGIEGFNVVDVMSECAKEIGGFGEFGGHAMAGGFALKNSSLDKFKNKLEIIAKRNLSGRELVPTLKIDAKIMAEDINWQTFETLETFAPYGPENPEVIFLLERAEIKEVRQIGKTNSHLKMDLLLPSSAHGKNIKAIGFGMGNLYSNLVLGDKIDIVFRLSVNQWNGHRDLEIKLIDFKKHAQ